NRHPACPRWILGVAAPLILVPETVLVASGNVGGLMSGFIAAAGLIATAVRYRNLPMALASAVPLTAVQLELVVKLSGSLSARSAAILVLLLGTFEIGAVAVVGGSRRLRGLMPWPLPGPPQQWLFAVALFFALFSL